MERKAKKELLLLRGPHNPKEYNGYKAYWTDGAQVTEPHDKNIIAEVEKITDVDKYHVDVFVMGDDWKGKFDFLKDKCEVVYLPRTPEISTTKIKTDLHT